MTVAQNDYEVEYDASDIQRVLDDIEEQSPDGYLGVLGEELSNSRDALLGFSLYGTSLSNILLSADQESYESSADVPARLEHSSEYEQQIYESVSRLVNAANDFSANAGSLEEGATVAAGLAGLSIIGASIARSYKQEDSGSVEEDLRALKHELEE